MCCYEKQEQSTQVFASNERTNEKKCEVFLWLTLNKTIRKKEFSRFLDDERNVENFFHPIMSHVYTEELNLPNYQLTMNKLINE